MSTRPKRKAHKQNRGNNPHTLSAVIRALETVPGATQAEVRAATGLAANTVTYALDRVAIREPGSWPYRYRVRNDVEQAIELDPAVAERLVKTTLPISEGWGRWARVCLTWPTSIARLSQSTNPAEIAQSLRTMAANAAALAQVFEAVKDEPDWLERIGGSGA